MTEDTSIRVSVVLVAVLVIGATVLTVAGAPVVAQESPGEPIAFFGDAEDGDGTPAPAGTEIVAVVDGEVADRITVQTNGVYAGGDPTDEKLRTHTAAGEEVTFHVATTDGPQADAVHQIVGPGVFQLDLVFPAGTFGNDETPPGDDGPAVGDGGDGAIGDSGVADGGVAQGGTGNDNTSATDGNTSNDGDALEGIAEYDANGRANATVEVPDDGGTARIDLGDGLGDGDSGPSITRINLTVEGNETGEGRSITFEGERLTGPPATGATFSAGGAGGGDDALSYFELSVTADDGDEDAIASATIGFTVDATDLDERGLERDDVALHRFNEELDVWEELDTEFVVESDGVLVFEATTPGFSLFAVGPRAQQDPPNNGTTMPAPDPSPGDSTGTDDPETETVEPTNTDSETASSDSSRTPTTETASDPEPQVDEPMSHQGAIVAGLLVGVTGIALWAFVARRRST